MRGRAWLRLAGVGAAALLALAGCGGGGDGGEGLEAGSGTGEITIWGHQGQEFEVEALQEAVSEFNSSQTDVKATLRLIPEADYTKTLTATSPSELPDVLEFDGPLMSSFVYAGKLGSVEGLVAQSTIDNQTDSVKAQNTYADGELYGLSMFDSGLGVYGSKKLLEAAGVEYPTGLDDVWTADEFEAALEQLAAKDPDGKVLDIKENYAGEWPTYGFLPVLYSTGNVVVEESQADGHLNDEKVVAAVEKFAGWHKYVDPNSDDKAFTNGRVALSWVGHWVFNAYDEALGDDLLVLPLPDFGEGTKTGQGSWAWGIGAQTENGKAAGKFLDFLMSDANVKAMTDANGAPPSTKSVAATSELYKPGGKLELFAEQLEQTCGTGDPSSDCVATPRPVTAAYPTISAQFSKAFFSAYRGGDAKSLLDQAAKAIDTDYKDNDNYEE